LVGWLIEGFEETPEKQQVSIMIDGITKTSRFLYFLPKGHYWNGYFLNGNIMIINHNNVLLDIIMDIIMI
jgi:hypothetical protein